MVTSGVGEACPLGGASMPLLPAQTQAPPTCWAEFPTVPLQIQGRAVSGEGLPRLKTDGVQERTE